MVVYDALRGGMITPAKFEPFIHLTSDLTTEGAIHASKHK